MPQLPESLTMASALHDWSVEAPWVFCIIQRTKLRLFMPDQRSYGPPAPMIVRCGGKHWVSRAAIKAITETGHFRVIVIGEAFKAPR